VAVASSAAATGNGEATRTRVIEAALTCIAEKGYYRASSNEIARTAGVTWGVIAHHFGSREALMLAALERAGERLHDSVVESKVAGGPLEERLQQYLGVLTAHYGQPTYLAYLQILTNLSRDPKTSERTAAVIARNSDMLQADVIDLQSAVLGPVPAGSDLSGFLFHACRGLVLSHLVLRSGAVSGAADLPVTATEQSHADLLVHALARELKALGVRD
jgi:AcrR family transcriptional regulator